MGEKITFNGTKMTIRKASVGRAILPTVGLYSQNRVQT